jgi:hypothetical protein
VSARKLGARLLLSGTLTASLGLGVLALVGTNAHMVKACTAQGAQFDPAEFPNGECARLFDFAPDQPPLPVASS